MVCITGMVYTTPTPTTEYQLQHVGENIVNEYIEEYESSFVGYLYILLLSNV
jgi:hypothetical protein